MNVLEHGAIGALAGAAVGDALGGATEGRSPEQIQARYGGPVTGIVGPFAPDWRTARPQSPYHKGDGHVTDDTLMTNMLVKVYEHKRDHLDAYDVDERAGPAADQRAGLDPGAGDRPRSPCSASSWPRSGWSPGCSTVTSTRARPASATSSTAAPRCTWLRSASPTPATPTAPTLRRSTSPGRTSPATAGRRPVSSPPPSPPRCAPARRPTSIIDTAPAARQGRHPRRDRGGLRGGREAARRHRRRDRAAAGDGPVRHARRGLPRPGPRRSAAQPAARDRGAAAGARLRGGRAAATTGGPCWPRSTTAATPTRSRPWPAPCAVRWAASRRSRRTGAKRSARGSRLDLTATGRSMAAVARGHLRERSRAGSAADGRLHRASWRGRSPLPPTRRRRFGGTCFGGAVRVTWVQPEDLLPHELVASREEGVPVDDIEARWLAAGGSAQPPVGGASAPPAAPALRALAERAARRDRAAAGAGQRRRARRPRLDPGHLADRSPGRPAGVDRATGCTAPGSAGPSAACSASRWRRCRGPGIREILEATGRWPLSGYFTAVGLPDDVSRALAVEQGQPADQPGREHRRDARRRRPELPADRAVAAGDARPGLHHRRRRAGVARTCCPAGRVFTAERVAYRNLLLGMDPPATARVPQPVPAVDRRPDPHRTLRLDEPGSTRTCAATLAYADARVSHVRNGVYGAMYAAALGAAAMVESDVDAVLDAGLAVVPPRQPVRRGGPVRPRHRRRRARLGTGRGRDRGPLRRPALGARAEQRGPADGGARACRGRLRAVDLRGRLGRLGHRLVRCHRRRGRRCAVRRRGAPGASGRRRCTTGWPPPCPGFARVDGVGFDELAERTLKVIR